MKTCRRFLQLFWVAALLFMASAQVMHAYQELGCVQEHAVEDSSSEDCPVGHQCCHTPVEHPVHHGAFVFSQQSLRFAELMYFGQETRLTEGALDEIKYPPRLS